MLHARSPARRNRYTSLRRRSARTMWIVQRRSRFQRSLRTLRGPHGLAYTRARLSTSFMRDCQPGPVALNFSITSRSSRSESACLFDPRGRPPRCFVNAASISGGSDSGPLDRANISSIHSGFSASGFEIKSFPFNATGAAQTDRPSHSFAERDGRAIRHPFDQTEQPKAAFALGAHVLHEVQDFDVGRARE
jgi:hypothetical protein